MEVKIPHRKRRTEPREIRRLQLIMAAIESISKRGFSGTTLKHVTEAAKVSHGVVNYHFESKEALYDATLGFLAQEHYETWTKYYNKSKPTAAHRLAAIISADFDKVISTPERLAVWFAFWGQAKYRPNYLKIHNRYDNERYELILQLSRDLVAEGGYQDIEAEQVTRTIEALSDGSWLSLMLYPDLADRTVYREDCLLALTRFFPKHFPI